MNKSLRQGKGGKVRSSSYTRPYRSQVNKNIFERLIAYVLVVLLTLQPTMLFAQSITVAGPDNGPRPRVDAAHNGTTVLNIDTPNQSGVSHDIFTDFTANDLILNNSATNVDTQLGGFIEGNPYLTPGNEASLWIGEVVGGNQTQLNGILEAAGKQLDVVLANEFGITCNGCGFVNTGRTTLTTGTPRFGANGALDGFDVKRGTVTIGAGGLNPESRLSLADTSRVDVIARAAAIYGQMRADELNIVAGANVVDYNWSYDAATGAVTGVTEQAGTGSAPALAVDVAALGGMYANAIQLIATENGVGVRLDNDLVSSTNISLRADGMLTLGNSGTGIKAKKKVRIRNKGPILLEGSVRSEDGDLLDIRTDSGTLTFTGEAQGGEIILESAGLATISATIEAQNSLRITSLTDGVTLADGSELSAASIDIDAATAVALNGLASTTGVFDVDAGTALTTGATSELRGQSVTFDAATIATSGTTTAVANLDLTALGAIANAGTLSGQNIAIKTDADFGNTGIVSASTLLEIDAGTVVTNAATLISGDDLNIYADQILNNGGVIWANDAVTLAADALLTRASLVQNTGGRIEAFQGDLTVRADVVENLGTAPTITSQIIKSLEEGSAGATVFSERVLQFIDPIFLGADGNILPAHATAFTVLWSELVTGGTSLSPEAQALLKSNVVSPSGTAISSDLIGLWSQVNARSNEEGVVDLGAQVASLVDPSIFDASGDVLPMYAEMYAALWQTLASGATTVDAAVRLILIDDVLEIESQETDPVTGVITTIYSNDLKPENTDVWAAISAGSSATYDIIKILYQDRFNDDGTLAELVAGGSVDIEADTVRNIYGNVSAGQNVDITANTVENRALGATQLLIEVHKRPDCFTCHEGSVDYYDTFGGRIEAVGAVNINASLTNITTPTSDLTGQDVLDTLNDYINEQRAAGDADFNGVAPVRNNNLELHDNRDDSYTAPVEGNGSDIREIIAVDTQSNTNVDVAPTVTPTLSPQASVDALLVAGLNTIAETDPEFTEFSNFITSNYMMDVDRLQYRDDLLNNTNETIVAALARATDAQNGALDTSYLDGPVLVPNPDGSGLHEVYPAVTNFELNPDGALIKGADINITGDEINNSGALLASNSASITGTNITGTGGRIIADTGEVALTALGRIAFEDVEIDGHSVDIIAGQDFVGKGVTLNSETDTTIFAAAGVTLTALEREYTLERKKKVTSVIGGGRDEEGTSVTREVVTATQTNKDQQLSALNVGGDLSIVTLADLELAGVAGGIGGKATLSAGGDLFLTAVQSEIDIQSDSINLAEVNSHVTNLEVGSDFTATAGGKAILVGTEVDTGGALQLSAAEDVVLAAAQDIYDYSKVTKKKGFLKKKVTTVTKTTVENKGVRLAALNDVDVIAETGDLTTAGSSFASNTGDINLTSVEGDIYAGAYTDIFKESRTVKKSYLGGLLSSTTSRTITDQFSTGTEALASLDLSLVSGGDTTLVGAQLAAGQNLNIQTGGDFDVQAAINSHREEFFSTKVGAITMTTITERSFVETAVLSSIMAGQGLSFDIGGDARLALYSAAGVDAPSTDGLYPEELLAIAGLQLLNEELADEYFYDKQTSLSPAFKALVAIAISVVLGPQLIASLGQSLAATTTAVTTTAAGATSTAVTTAFGVTTTVTSASGAILSSTASLTALGTGTSAFLSSAAIGTLDGVVSGDFDVGKILEGAAFSGITAGLTAGINVNFPEGHAFNNSIIKGFGSGQFTTSGLLNAGLDGVVSSGLSSAVYGTDFGDGVLSSVVNYVANGVAGAAIEDVADIYGHDVHNIQKFIAKATINCIASEAKGSSCGAGAVGSLVTEILSSNATTDGEALSAEDIEKLEQDIKLVSAIAGYFVSGGEAVNVSAAVTAAELDYDNNWIWFAVRAGVFAWTVYEVYDAVEALDGEFDRLYGDGVLTEAEAQELKEAAAAVGVNIVVEVTAGKVVKGLKIASVAGDFSVAVAKKLGLDKTLANLNKKFNGVKAPNTGVPDNWTRLNPAGAQINAPRGYTTYRTPNGDMVHVSPSGLQYGADPKFGNRVDHILDHTAPNPNKPVHSVFNAQGDDALRIVDDAWANRTGPGTPQTNGNRTWTVDLGRPIGTTGQTSVQIVVRDGTTEIITAFPK